MKAGPTLLLALLAVATAAAQTTPSARSTNPAPRAGQGKDAKSAGPDPDLFDGTKFEKEVRPETGMIGEFEMPGSNESQDNKVGGNPGQPGGSQTPPPKPGASGASGAPSTPAGASGGAEAAAAAAGSEGASGGSSVDNSGAAGAVGGALDQSKPQGKSGQSSGAGDPNAKADGMQADSLQGGAAGEAAAQSSVNQANRAKSAPSKIGSAELRIETLPESDKDVIGREAAAGGTQGSNRPMPNGKAGQGSQNQNKGVEKGKVIPKGL